MHAILRPQGRDFAGKAKSPQRSYRVPTRQDSGNLQRQRTPGKGHYRRHIQFRVHIDSRARYAPIPPAIRIHCANRFVCSPPGTGKTKTVVGIAGALLTQRSSKTIPIPGAAQAKQPAVKKILVCAPSNAAVDELVIRFKKGLTSATGETWVPGIVRLGRSDAINAEVRDVTLEELVDARMATTNNASKGAAVSVGDLQEQLTKASESRNAKQQQLDDYRVKKLEPPINLLPDIERLNTTIREQRRQLVIQQDQKKESGRNAKILRQQHQQQIINESHIICATLSGAGHEMLRNVNVDFETVIIDEAAQSVELSALIPLKFGCDKCILVGDPQQLPPTVLSRDAAKFSYEKSLFVRMQENFPENVHLLSIQYRMHPAISAFPSREFYEAGLRDGDGMAVLRKQPWHDSSIFGPYRFFNVAGTESRKKTSLINSDEARMALALFGRITVDFPEVNFEGRIGVVTPYRQQLGELRRVFKSRYGEEILVSVEFNTVDAFQGRERDIIIFSCVRAATEGGVGFLSDVRRMNVGLTRAKSSVFILGNAEFLVRNHMWKRLVEDAKERNMFTPVVRGLFDRPTRTSAGSLQPPPPPLPPPPHPQPIRHHRQPASNSAQQVDAALDPMDVDGDEFHTNPSHQNNPVKNQGQGPKAVQNQSTQRPRGDPPHHPPVRGPHNKDANIACHVCGMKGHRRADCPGVQRDRNPQTPALEGVTAPPAQPKPKRPAEFDEPPGKRVYSETGPTPTAAGSPSNAPAPGSNAGGGGGGSGGGVGFIITLSQPNIVTDEDRELPTQTSLL